MAMHGIDPIQAKEIIKNRRCSDCWEVLQEYYDPQTRSSTVSCSTPNCPCRGHVSAKYVENALAESRLKQRDAEKALGETGAVEWIPKPAQKSERAILAELGFK
jgi:hypothetical protein